MFATDVIWPNYIWILSWLHYYKFHTGFPFSPTNGWTTLPMLLTCRSSRWALAGVLYSIRLCVCRSTGRLQGPVQTNAFSSLSTDHNTAHKHWTDKTKRWGGRRRGRLSQCTVITHKKGRPWVNPFICSSLLLRATAKLCCMWQLYSIAHRIPQSRQKVKQ